MIHDDRDPAKGAPRAYTGTPDLPPWNDLPPEPGQAPPLRDDDVSNARRLIDAHGDNIRWVPEWADWLVWDGTRWARDAGGGAVVQYAIETVQTLHTAAGNKTTADERKAAAKWALTSGARTRIDAMIVLARADPRVLVRPGLLDADPWQLNCSNGTIDLRTGRLMVHNKADLITKSTGLTYDPGRESALFDRYLGQVQPDAEMRAYLQRLIGHALVGEVLENVLPIWHGSGGNGKSVLTELLIATLGDYASTVPATLLLVKTNAGHPTELADLQGLRLVFATETDQTKRLDEATVKALTGGDTIKARFLYRDFFEFTPSHSVILVTNYAPTIRGNDTGIWRRLRMVPWPVQIAADQVQLDLGAQLKREREAVLAWVVEGCRDWHINGMGEPLAVIAATEQYREDEDAFGRFLTDRTVVNNAGGGVLKVSSSLLRRAYLDWCTAEHEDPLSVNAVAAQLRSRGCKDYRTMNFRGWEGLGLVGNSAETDEP